MAKKFFKDPLDFGNFKTDVDNINKTAENIPDPIERIKFYSDRAKHYKHLAQIDGIREPAQNAVVYFTCMSKRLEKKCQK